MTKERPSQVQTHHLERLAIAYVRKSIVRQTDEHLSIDSQRNLSNLALRWGWILDRIIVIDKDCGQSGTTTVKREGFQRLLRLIDQGCVGAIFCANPSRLSRVASDFNELVSQCRLHDTLLVINGHIINANNSFDHLS